MEDAANKAKMAGGPVHVIFPVLLLCGDLVFIMLHSIERLTPLLNDKMLSLGKDKGYPEMFQYIKWYWIVILLLLIAYSRRSIRYATWAMVFFYVLIDDALRVHERLGAVLALKFESVPVPFGLRAQDLGELAVLAIAGAVLIFPILFAFRNGGQVFRRLSIELILMILVTAFFGVTLDMAHETIRPGAGVIFTLGLLEDGGEMVMASLILSYVLLEALPRDERYAAFLSTLRRKGRRWSTRAWDLLPV